MSSSNSESAPEYENEYEVELSSSSDMAGPSTGRVKGEFLMSLVTPVTGCSRCRVGACTCTHTKVINRLS
jgi:hypothetical protein